MDFLILAKLPIENNRIERVCFRIGYLLLAHLLMMSHMMTWISLIYYYIKY